VFYVYSLYNKNVKLKSLICSFKHFC